MSLFGSNLHNSFLNQLPREALRFSVSGRRPINEFLTQLPREALWHGVSGRCYSFRIHPIGTVFGAESGVYIPCTEVRPDNWLAHYVGEADDLDARIGSGRFAHHKWASIVKSGTTHISTLVVRGDRTERLAIETDIRQCYRPRLCGQ